MTWWQRGSLARPLAPVALMLVLLLLASGPAAAQSAGDVERVSVGGGVGVANIFHGDFPHTPPAFEAGLAIRRSPRVSFEIDLGRWGHAEENELFDVPIQGPSGIIGRAAKIVTREDQTFTTFGFNVMASGRVGRVRVSGGGGAGFMTFERGFRQTLEGCSGSVTCGTTETGRSSVSGIVQAVGRLEVPVAAHVSAYGATTFFVNLRDVAFSGIRPAAGIRIRF